MTVRYIILTFRDWDTDKGSSASTVATSLNLHGYIDRGGKNEAESSMNRSDRQKWRASNAHRNKENMD